MTDSRVLQPEGDEGSKRAHALSEHIAKALKIPRAALDGISQDRLSPLVNALDRLVAGKSLAPEAVALLRSFQLHTALARYYESGYARGGSLGKAAGAVRAWRLAGRPRDALRVLMTVNLASLEPYERGRVFTNFAATLVDLRELSVARRIAEEAVRCNRSWSDHPQRVLARIARYEGLVGEASARSAQARHIEAYRMSDRLDAEGSGLAGPSHDAALYSTYKTGTEKPKRLGRTWYESYLRTPEWAQRRLRALDLSGHACERCGSGGLLHVHHVTYARVGMELPSDLEALCPTCHEREHAVELSARGQLRDLLGDASMAGSARCQPASIA